MQIVIYRLRRDKKFIASVQHATQMTDKFGIEAVHGLFGAAEWWEAIKAGVLPVHTLRGIVTKLYMGSMNDWPEFSMRSDAGAETSWSRYANGAELGKLYEVGQPIEIDYVIERHREKSFDFGAETKCVIEIRIGKG
jgi:hypothetical protein